MWTQHEVRSENHGLMVNPFRIHSAPAGDPRLLRATWGITRGVFRAPFFGISSCQLQKGICYILKSIIRDIALFARLLDVFRLSMFDFLTSQYPVFPRIG
jgi:hypothetical protein